MFQGFGTFLSVFLKFVFCGQVSNGNIINFSRPWCKMKVCVDSDAKAAVVLSADDDSCTLELDNGTVRRYYSLTYL
jgi:hypothetical protein